MHIYTYIYILCLYICRERKRGKKNCETLMSWYHVVPELHSLQHTANTAIHPNTLQHTATRCNIFITLHHTATRCNTLQHTVYIGNETLVSGWHAVPELHSQVEIPSLKSQLTALFTT